MAELKIQMTLDLKPFSKGLVSALNMGKSFRTQFTEIASGIRVDVDESAFKNEIKKLDGIYDQFRKEAQQEVKLDADGKKIKTEAGKAEAAVKKVPKKHNTVFTGSAKSLTDSIASMGIAVGAITMGIRKVTGVIGGWVTASNMQEQADNRLINTLKIKGIYTDAYFKKLKDTASAIQKVTTVGDEQSEMLMGLAVNMKVSQDKVIEATQGAIGLASAFKDAGLSQELALKGIALAYQGNFTQLQRYIPELRSAKTEAEKMAILQRNMADGFKLAQEETKTGAGAIIQYTNIVGDLKEKIGDMVKKALLPVMSIMSNIVTYLNENQAVFQGIIITLGAITLGLVAAKIATINWNLSLLANPVVAIIAGLVALGVALNIGVQKIGGWRQAWEYAKASIQITWEYIKAFGQGLVNFGSLAIDIVTLPWKILWETVKEVFTNIGTAWKLLLSGDFAGAFEIAKRGITTGFQGAMDDVKANAGTLLDTFDGLGAKSKEIWQAAKIDVKEVTGAVEEVSSATETAIELTAEQEATIKKAKAAWESWAKAYDESKMTERQKIKIEFEAQEANLAATFEKGTPEFKAAYQKLLDWRKEQETALDTAEIAAKKEKYATIMGGYSDYYNQVKFEDDSYYEWRNNEIDSQYAAELQRLLTAGMDQAEAERIIAEQKNMSKQELDQAYWDWKTEKTLEQSQFEMAILDSMLGGYRSFVYSLTDTTMKGNERLKKAWETMKRQFIGAVADMTANWIKQKAIEVIVQETTDKAIEKSHSDSILRMIALDIWAATKKVAISIWAAAGSIFSFFSSLGPFGIPLAVAAIGATVMAINSFRKGFAQGGPVRGGKQTIQVNEEGEEFVVNAPATRILGTGLLTKIMAFPQKTKEILSQVAFPGVDIPQPAFAFDTGGSTANVSNINSNLIVDLEPVNLRLEALEDRITEIKEAILGKELRVDIDAAEMAVIVENGNKVLEAQDL